MRDLVNRAWWTAAIALLVLTAGCERPPEAPVDEEVVVEDEAPEEAQPQETVPDAPAVEVSTLPDEELAEGWVLLFDESTFFGWEVAGEAQWRASEGILAAGGAAPGLLVTRARFADFELAVDFRAPEGARGAVLVRADEEGTDEGSVRVGIAPPAADWPTGSIVGHVAAETETLAETWHTLSLAAEGERITVALDGQPVAEHAGAMPGRGHVALVFEGDPIEYRNIKLRPLGLASIFNGEDLSGWTTYPEMEGDFFVSEEGWLRAQGGRGQLETEGAYGDFVMQLEVICNSEEANSGVFFRCIPGSTMDGYESQIHNGFEEGDRTRPTDAGTGGIFRRQDARYVVADDFEWFHKTILADGPHMAVWVDGYQVSSWTDTRDPDPNPRRGLRLEPGTIMLQAHDPEMDVSFRNLEIIEQAPR